MGRKYRKIGIFGFSMLVLLAITASILIYTGQVKIKALENDFNALTNKQELLQKKLASQDEFFLVYSKAINSIAMAEVYFRMASINENEATSQYSYNKDYSYQDVRNTYSLAEQQSKKVKKYLLGAEKGFNTIKNNTSNGFWENEIQDRLDQVAVFVKLADSQFRMIDFRSNELVQTNLHVTIKESLESSTFFGLGYHFTTGAQEKAKEYQRKANEEIITYNLLLNELNAIEDKIAIRWIG